MRSVLLITAIFSICFSLNSQNPIVYKVSFENAVHHEANVSIKYSNLPEGELRIRMSRSSPGRYAVHEFAKNVYGFSATDGQGKTLSVIRANPQEWRISGHKGSVHIRYTLFANHGDGTYAQVDGTHAHLNIPASFAYAPDYPDRPIEIEIIPREDLNWKVATQLKPMGENRYQAPDFYYFMDSPIEVSDHKVKSFEVGTGTRRATIRFALHQENGYEGYDEYQRKVEAVVMEQLQVFDELPDFDFGTYTFLACYAPNVDGDGMEHRNSTVITSTLSLSEGGQERNIGTVAHEFFHAWNVERIRPRSLEPFDFEDANMSGELWFAEGFTSYYTNLTLCRAGILSVENYVQGLGGVLNYVINSPGRELFNPIEMSYQAPFVDAATSVDQVNRENTFISYYSYGNVLGLALDLSLRRMDSGKNLDDFMKLVWVTHGKTETPYTLDDLKKLLADYSDPVFADQFFSDYIYDGKMPEFTSTLADFGILFEKAHPEKVRLGARISVRDRKWVIDSYPIRGSALYKAGFSNGDQIVSIDGKLTDGKVPAQDFLGGMKPGQLVKVKYLRRGELLEKDLTLDSDPNFSSSLNPDRDGREQQRLEDWLIRKKI